MSSCRATNANAMRVPCYSCEPDPRDARIAELETALRGLVEARSAVDALLHEERLGNRSYDRGSESRRGATMIAYEQAKAAAERALGRRK